ncbi:MAG: hypothetical protein HY567_03850 [Candidatus Kerfeldbacteria bacterium]|nr:hypothetical protein [Candidatus Kerfeldbacteria bacterium]
MNLDQELQALKDRNARVEADKAWETSWLRALIIAGSTYVIAGITLQLVGASKPWLTALVPTLGFYLSTLTLPPVKRWWLGRHK